MHIHVPTTKHRREQAHILLTALVLAVTLAIAVASFAFLVSGQNKSVTRSQTWNQCIPVAESGVEEALTQLYWEGTNGPENGWVTSNGLYFKQRSVGTDGSYYIVSIVPSNKPVITATGYALEPLSKTKYVSRTVQVKAAKAPAPKGGIVARGSVILAGGGYLDSFDSSDPNYSTNGLYTQAKRKDNGQVTSNSGNIILNGGGSGGGIYGYAITGPTGSVQTSGGVGVGDLAYITGGNSGVQAGHSANNANVDFPAVKAPSSSGTYSPTPGLFNGTNYAMLLQNANYYTSSSVKLNAGEVLGVVGNVTLYVNNSVSIKSMIYMYPGSSLKLYVSGDLAISGGGVLNSTLNAANLSIYGVNTSAQTWSYNGGSAFMGTIYAPNCDLTFGGGADVTGSITANTVIVKGGSGIHYDETLAPSVKGFVIISWNEI